MSKAFAVFAKDIRLEFRSRYAINSILMFGVTTLAMISFSLGQSGLSPKVLSALFWIVLFFSSTAGLSLVFVREEETGTALALRLSADPTAVYLGKLFFNFSLLSLMAFVITPLFFVFTDAIIGDIMAFILTLLLGIVGLCGASTLVAAIISRAAMKGALFAVLSFPLMITLMILLVSGTAKAMEGASVGEIGNELQALLAYAVIMITASLLLFRHVWED